MGQTVTTYRNHIAIPDDQPDFVQVNLTDGWKAGDSTYYTGDAWFEEDFESYLNIAQVLAAPHISDQTYHPSHGELLLNTGLTGTPWGGTKAIQSHFYGGIPEAQVGISIIPPNASSVQPREVWTEHYIMFTIGWDAGMDHKSYFYTDDDYNRWHVHFGVFGTDIQFLINNGSTYYTYYVPGDIDDYVWDNTWHRLRCHFKMSSDTGQSDGEYQCWFDDDFLADDPGLDTDSPASNWFRGYDLGRNIGNQPDLPEGSFYNAGVKIYLNDPGWSS